jgi:TM2 domain-containing membrane protein YozV
VVVSDVSGGPGWWQASDGKWYAPELHPDAASGGAGDSIVAAHAYDNVLATPATDDVFAPPATDVLTPAVSAPAADNVFAAPPATDDVFAPPATDVLTPAVSAPAGDDVFAAPTTGNVFAAPTTDNVFAASQPQSDGRVEYPSIQYPSYTTGKHKSKLAAGLLGIFLGWLGIHRFYLGFKKLGLTMLLLTVLSVGVFAPLIIVWGVVEGILILMGKLSHDAYGDTLA